MLKYAHAQIMTKALAPKDAGARELRRFAHRHHFDYEVRPGYLYVRSRAISSRCNDNFDEFPAEELEKSYRTFIGKPVFVNHHNEDHRRARGVIIDAVLHKDANRDGSKDYWVELLQEVDALRFPRLAAEILNGNIARTSMGTDVAYSICSACRNKATSPAEYCQHIPASKGMTLYRTTASGQKVGELIRETCFGLRFFENSLLVEPPADPTAFFLGVDDRGLKTAAAASEETATHAMPYQAPPSPTVPRPAVPSSTQRTAGLDVVNATKDPRFEGVSLKQDDDGWYVTTHRARSDSYESPEKIPQKDVDFIESTGAVKTAVRAYSWDEIGQMHPEIYGDSEYHGERAKYGDGQGIGSAANDLAHSTPDDPDAENHDVGELKFRHMMVSPNVIDHKRHEAGDHRVLSAARGYKEHPDQMPPVVLVHRHGVYQVADGHHRAEGAKKAGVDKIPAYVANSPYPDVPHEFGSAPYHGARKSNPPSFGRTQQVPEGQQRLFEASRVSLADLMAEGAAATPPEDHPWFKQAGLSHHHVLDHWDAATDEEKAQGKRWYPDAHLVALNADGDSSPGQKGRNTVQRNQRKTWQDLSREHTPELHQPPANSHVSKVAFGEQKAPQDVDTLREDACPVCGDRDTFDGATCQVCGYVAPPKMFQDPDLEKARQMDLRKDIAEFNDPANPMAQGQVGPDGQPIDPQEQAGGPMDPGALDENGNPINPDAADPNAQPGSLPGEVQAEVQPGGDPMDPQMLGPDGTPLDPQGMPSELGAPVDPAMLGPDGQPLQQPGQQMMVGPNGEPIGPQALPADAVSSDGQPFTPGPNMPQGPGEPEQPQGPEGPMDPGEMGPDGQVPNDGQIPNPDAGQGVPGTPGDGVPDLQCPACGFTADATNPVSVDMDTSIMPPTGEATPDGVQAGDVCPNCGAGQLISPAEGQGQVPLPVPV